MAAWEFGWKPRYPFDTSTSLIAPMPAGIRYAGPVVGARASRDEAGHLTYVAQPPAAADTRVCQWCPTILSQWNSDPVCGPCQRANRDEYPPREFKRDSVVYYATDGDRIKIGTSGNVTHRLRNQGGLLLLATEPGRFTEEKARHEQFAHLRITGEWFRPAEELWAHIDSLLEDAA